MKEKADAPQATPESQSPGEEIQKPQDHRAAGQDNRTDQANQVGAPATRGSQASSSSRGSTTRGTQ